MVVWVLMLSKVVDGICFRELAVLDFDGILVAINKYAAALLLQLIL
jgi:hypothetical protein